MPEKTSKPTNQKPQVREKRAKKVVVKRFACKKCPSMFTTSQALYRHQKHYCVANPKNRKKEQNKEQNKEENNNNNSEFEELKNKIDIMYNAFLNKKDSDQIKEEMQQEMTQVLKDTGKAVMDANKKANDMVIKTQDNYKFILQHFTNAPNLELPDNLEEILYNNMDSIIESPNQIKAISDLLVDNITTSPAQERFIHGVDRSRNKFITKKDDAWCQDQHASLLIRDFMRVLHKSCQKYSTKNMKKMSDTKIFKTAAFMDYIRTDCAHHKVARAIYDKVHLDQISYYKNIRDLQIKYN